MDRTRATEHPLSTTRDEESQAAVSSTHQGSALDGGNALRRSRSRSGFGSVGDSNPNGFGSFDHGTGAEGLLAFRSKPRSARVSARLNRVRSRVAGGLGWGVRVLNATGFGRGFRKPPRAANLFRLVAALAALAAVLNLTRCGFVLCAAGRGGEGMGFVDGAGGGYEKSTLAKELASLYVGDGDAESRFGDARFGDENKPRMIPKLIHQTYKTRDVPDAARPMMATWADMNPGWEVRFWDDAACLEMVRVAFPEYALAYESLPKNVERSDFFRYLVVLRFGGVYSDIDATCVQPLDSWIRGSDSLVVGWEGEFGTDEMAYSRHFVRRRQVLNWAFAGAKGHPALREVCDQIASRFQTTFSNNANRDTLERTGPGVFTDAVLRHWWRHSAGRNAVPREVLPASLGGGDDFWDDESKRGGGETGETAETKNETETETETEKWSVRVMPKVSFGTHPSGEDGVSQADESVLIAHKYLGSWKSGKGWSAGKSWADLLRTFWHSLVGDLAQHRAARAATDKWYAMPSVNPHQGYPVSTNFDPPFDVLTHLLGTWRTRSDTGVTVNERDVEHASTEAAGASLTKWGRYQPSGERDVSRRDPQTADALVGSLETLRGSVDAKFHLVDVNAGLGYVSLAAASRGFSVLALSAENDARALFAGAAKHNGFAKLIEIRGLRIGGRGEGFCRALVAAERTRDRDRGDQAISGATQVTIETLRVARINREDGAGSSQTAGFAETRLPFACALAASLGIVALDDLILVGDEDTSSGNKIGALRVASNGWELHVIRGAARLLTENPPNVLVLELAPFRLRLADFFASDDDDDAAGATGGDELLLSKNELARRKELVGQEVTATMKWLWGLGYTEVAHAGEACDERRRISEKNEKPKLERETDEKQTWCAFSLRDVASLCSLPHAEHPETVMLRHRGEVAG